jgi:enoyl-CoA hydratase/carnithine racemase
MLQRLQEELAIAADRQTHAIIVFGAGDCFSAGADISELTGTKEDVKFDDALAAIGESIRSGPYLVIAAIHGACVGAAFDLACSCDVRVCAESAFFEIPSVKLGLLYNPASISRLHKIIRGDAFRRLLLLGERIRVQDAHAAGIATHIVDAAELNPFAKSVSERAIAAPRAMVATKKYLAALEADSVDKTYWQSVRLELLDSTERRAAVKSAQSHHF